MFSGDLPLQVKLDLKGLYAVLRKKAYGATLDVGAMNRFCATDGWLYLHNDAELFRLEAQGVARQASLLSMLSWNEPLYIRESDLSTVCR